MLILLFPMMLAACSSEPDEPVLVPERDPIVTQALNDQILVDPDLVGQNEANAALTGGTDHSVPPVVNTREAVERARQDAADLVGGFSNLRPLPEAGEPGDPLPLAAQYSAGELAKAAGVTGACADGMGYTAMWAAKMPEALPVYPRGNTIEAAGNDSAKCSVRVVRFLTPVSREDVLSFYAARAKSAKIPASYRTIGAVQALEGTKGRKRYSIYAHRRPSGISEVALVTDGF